MKNFNILIFTLFFSSVLCAQEFSFKMYFEDAVGNKDTLTFGYDINGTDTIDSFFGETNIINLPIDTNFEVRITDEYWNRFNQSMPGTFHTKTQIINKNCGNWFSISVIDVHTKNWPVTVKWDSTLFNNTCRNGSLFTSMHPGGWWDVGSPSNLYRAVLLDIDSVSFSSNIQHITTGNYDYVNSNNDTVPVFWQAFGDSTILATSIENLPSLEKIRLYPNPTSNKLNFEYNKNNIKIKNIKIIDITGREKMAIWNKSFINIEALSNGVYFIQITLQNKSTTTYKIIKN